MISLVSLSGQPTIVNEAEINMAETHRNGTGTRIWFRSGLEADFKSTIEEIWDEIS